MGPLVESVSCVATRVDDVGQQCATRYSLRPPKSGRLGFLRQNKDFAKKPSHHSIKVPTALPMLRFPLIINEKGEVKQNFTNRILLPPQYFPPATTSTKN